MSSFFVLNLDPITVETLLIILFSVTLFGSLLVGSYILTHKHQGIDMNFVFTLFIMPIVVSIVVLLVSNNLARAFSLAGVFTLVRFRLAMRDSSDLGYILASVAIGLSLALGFVLLGFIITLFLVLSLTLFSLAFIIDKNPYEKLIITYSPNEIDHIHIEDSIKDHCDYLKIHRIKYNPKSNHEIFFKIQRKKDLSHETFYKTLESMAHLINFSIQEDLKR